MARTVMDTSVNAVVFAEERLCSCEEEYFAFVHAYWDDAPENEDELPVEFDREVYERMDTLRAIRLLVGRHYGKMVAAALYIVIPSPKHKSIIIGQCDTFAVARVWRGQGLGKRMMEHVIKMMQMHSVHSILNGYREVFGETTPLFEKLGFEPYERFYRLVIPTRVAEGDT